jgi:glycosyltransferase domain-containing protein
MISLDWEKMPNLSELTLVMPTYNRHRYALRQMQFWSGSPVSLFVLDGSSTPINDDAIKTLGKNIHYYHFPISYEKRFGKAAELIKTPFAASLCDDEFFIPSALERCIEFLKNNKEYGACIGRCSRIIYLNTGVSSVHQYKTMKNYKITEDDKKERVLHHMTDYVHTTMYAVQRAEIWKKTMSIFAMDDYHFSCPYIVELLVEISTCYQGKSMVIDNLMWLRSEENAPADGEERHVGFQVWMKDPKYQNERSVFLSKLEKSLSKIFGNEASNDFKEALERYKLFRRGYSDNSKKITLPKIKTNITQLLSVKTEHQVNILLAYLNLSGWSPWKTAVKRLETEGVNVDTIQFEKIVETVEDFHKKNTFNELR